MKKIEELIKKKSFQIKLLKAAEAQFCLASAVNLATTYKKQPLDLPIEWWHGQHKVQYHEIALSPEEAVKAASYMKQMATYLMAVQILNAIRNIYPNPKNHTNPYIVSTYQITRMIRNAFAHQPFHPVWSIDDDCKNKIFEIKGIIKFDTHNIDQNPFDWRHYGGPLALFRLSQFVREKLLGEVEIREKKDNLKPKNVYYQQGNLLLKKVNKIPKGAKKII